MRPVSADVAHQGLPTREPLSSASRAERHRCDSNDTDGVPEQTCEVADPTFRLTPVYVAGFWRRVEVMANGCWLWKGSLRPTGYGAFSWREDGEVRGTPAIRAAYRIVVGPIPDGHQLDHLCHTADPRCTAGNSCPHRACVNPTHLEPVTALENARRSRQGASWNARKTHCPHGHPYDSVNTYTSPAGRRYCKPCKREALRRFRARHAA